MKDSKFRGLLTSRKFYATVAGVLFVLLKAYVKDFPLSEEQVTAIVALLGTYIVSTAMEKPKAPDQSGKVLGE